ncbi:MAG: hypothetical protein ACI8Y8_003418, partial [Planctomycetota bacterium]
MALASVETEVLGLFPCVLDGRRLAVEVVEQHVHDDQVLVIEGDVSVVVRRVVEGGDALLAALVAYRTEVRVVRARERIARASGHSDQLDQEHLALERGELHLVA